MVNYTDEFKCISAVGKGKNVLILRKLESPVKRFDGKIARYELEHRWLSCACDNEKDQAWACVMGQDFTYWQGGEVKAALGGKCLFECFNLF